MRWRQFCVLSELNKNCRVQVSNTFKGYHHLNASDCWDLFLQKIHSWVEFLANKITSTASLKFCNKVLIGQPQLLSVVRRSDSRYGALHQCYGRKKSQKKRMKIQETGCYINFPYCANKKIPGCLSINSNTIVLYPFTNKTIFFWNGTSGFNTPSDDGQWNKWVTKPVNMSRTLKCPLLEMH